MLLRRTHAHVATYSYSQTLLPHKLMLCLCFSQLVPSYAGFLPLPGRSLRGGVELRSAFARLASSIIISSCVSSPAIPTLQFRLVQHLAVRESKSEPELPMFSRCNLLLLAIGRHIGLHVWHHCRSQQAKQGTVELTGKGMHTPPASSDGVQCRVAIPH